MLSLCWFFLFIILLIIEIFTVNLVSIWFAIGSLVCVIVSNFISNIFIQIAIFIIVSIVALLITKPLMKKIRTREKVATNSDRVIGQIGIVTKEITKNNPGEVKVLSTVWMAVSDKKINEGEEVLVEKIDGVKLYVSKVNEE